MMICRKWQWELSKRKRNACMVIVTHAVLAVGFQRMSGRIAT